MLAKFSYQRTSTIKEATAAAAQLRRPGWWTWGGAMAGLAEPLPRT